MSSTVSLQTALLPAGERFNPEEFMELMYVFDAAFRSQGIETPLVMLHMAFTLTYPTGLDMGHHPGAVWESRFACLLPTAFIALLPKKHIKSLAWERGNCSGYSSLKYKQGFGKKARNACL